MPDLSAQLLSVETELKRLQTERKNLQEALGDPKLTAWVGGGVGRVAPRQLTAFEAATARRISSLFPKITKLELEARSLVSRIVVKLAKKTGDGADDPEVLLRASLVVLSKTARGSVEGRAVMRALTDYLRSLAADG